MTDERQLFWSRHAFLAITTIIIIAALSSAQALFIPITVAFILTIILQLPLTFLERYLIPRWIGAVLLVLMSGAAIWLLAALISGPIQTFANDYQQIARDLRMKLFQLEIFFQEASDMGQAVADVGKEVAKRLEDPGVQEVVVRDNNFLVRAASSLAESMTTFVATLIICAFMLALRKPMTTLVTMMLEKPADKLRAARIWANVEQHIGYFFFVTTIINVSLGACVGLVLYFLDVPMPAFWAVLVGILNYMPFIGPTIGALSLLIFCFLQFDSVFQILVPPAAYLLINFIEANFVTPAMIARRTEIPALAIILSLFFWGWLWGFIGLLVAIPVLVIVKAVAMQVEEFKPVQRILTPRARR
ncbi:MAG: AI-2E family transporter [Ahrensia sp.]